MNVTTEKMSIVENNVLVSIVGSGPVLNKKIRLRTTARLLSKSLFEKNEPSEKMRDPEKRNCDILFCTKCRQTRKSVCA